jgi:glutaconyl-CoA decarboxylase
MRVHLATDGKEWVVDVDLEGGVVTIDGRPFAFQILDRGGERVELEIEGERRLIEGWPSGRDEPLEGIAVNGERVRLKFGGRSAGSGTPGPVPRPAAAPIVAPLAATTPTGPSTVILPPMPGKVIEVRVREGDRVAAGQILLVLEAMKMRNDVLAPSAGVVRELKVTAGANVRAREPMLRLAPD